MFRSPSSGAPLSLESEAGTNATESSNATGTKTTSTNASNTNTRSLQITEITVESVTYSNASDTNTTTGDMNHTADTNAPATAANTTDVSLAPSRAPFSLAPFSLEASRAPFSLAPFSLEDLPASNTTRDVNITSLLTNCTGEDPEMECSLDMEDVKVFLDQFNFSDCDTVSFYRAALLEQRTSPDECGLGYICDEVNQINCTIMRFVYKELGFGDLHAGLYCPNNFSDYTNCDAGRYCETPELNLPCPAGFFCPHKTAKPEIVCTACGAGAKELERGVGGYIIMLVLIGATICYLVFSLVRRYRKEQLKRVWLLAERRIDSIRLEAFRRGQQKELEAVKPQLDLIASRWSREKSASSLYDSASLSDSNPILVTPSGDVTFNALRLFNGIDTNCDGFLTYEQVNVILQLDRVQIREFVRRMNTLGGMDRGLNTVSRSVFCRYFIKVLAETSHFRPTRKEAAKLFDDIAETQGTNKHGDIESSSFYSTPLLHFLTDSQINDLLVRLRRCPRDARASMTMLPPILRRASTTAAKLKSTAQPAAQRSSFLSSVLRTGTVKQSFHRAPVAIQRDTFIKNYPRVLIEVVTDPDRPSPVASMRVDEEVAGVDIAFENLTLSVNVGGEKIYVVDKVTGRLRGGTMTALMGGSGAGKSSLLNALCGRAFYGEIGGTILINGQQSSIEEQSHCIGFVPQDDIVYAELTVRENFVYSGRFRLPKGTPLQDVYDLADATLASLGLSRVANSIVGDVNRRGVSGGEKKRVNIGLELMSRPRALFLDEPTSGLDSSSAFLVMQSLRTLVENQGVTVCSVIHQPRKIIFEMFDDLILLGVGGKVVYNGPVSEAQAYVEGLNYQFPAGDSVADWLIDVSAGQAEPVEPGEQDGEMNDSQVIGLDSSSRRASVSVVDDSFAHNAGLSSNEIEENHEKAKIRREELYRAWEAHCDNMTGEEKEQYQAPEKFSLPAAAERASFLSQLWVQLRRNVLVARRNATSKLLDTFLIVGAVILIAYFEGVVSVTRDVSPEISLESLVSGPCGDPAGLFGSLFQYAGGGARSITEYALKTGILTAVLVGLTAAKAITEKRLEFFREAASGYDVNAYFLAVNITATLEHSCQALLAAAAAFWLRDSLASSYVYFVNFLMMAWLCVSWALLLPLLVPPKNVVLVTGFFMAFFGLLFSGGLQPVQYRDIYEKGGFMALFSGFVSPTRYFIEALVVSEFRCLPEQSGFTQTDEAENFPPEANPFRRLNMALNDYGVSDQSCSGWYWGVLPALLVGLTVRLAAAGVIHVSGRAMQAKRPLLEELRKKRATKGGGETVRKEGRRPSKNLCNPLRVTVVVFAAAFFLMFALSAWAILREVEEWPMSMGDDALFNF